MSTAVLKCKMCGGNIIPVEGKSLGVCDSCGTTVTMPTVTDARRADVFNRGNHFRRTYEFDKALEEYAQIIKEDPTDAEAHWCMMLCRYGINYQEDHRTGERIPTCDRVSFTPITEDPDYQAALQYADGDQKALYLKEIQRLQAIQQGILEVSAKETPFDVFICFKDTDDKTGKRTQDSVLAQDLYTELTKRDYKVFFSRITLKEEHMGQEWEPYIFAALNSARVMLAVGTSAKNLASPWVKNEWSRFLNLRRSDKTKILIPCVSGMDPKDLPAGLKELEGRDMKEISFMQDLLYGIERVVRPTKKESSDSASVSAENYVKRAMIALEDQNYDEADEMLEKALDLDPENGQAHLGKLLVELQCPSLEKLVAQDTPLSSSVHYNRALKYCGLGEQQQLRAAESQIQQRLEDREKSERLSDLLKNLKAADSSLKVERIISSLKSMGSFGNAQDYVKQAEKKLVSLREKEAREAEERKKQDEAEAAARAAQKEADRIAEAQAAKEAKRKRRSRRIRRCIIWLIILAVALYFCDKKFLRGPRETYDMAEAHVASGDYRAATEEYFAASKSKLSRLFFPDAEEKGIEACALWLGEEPVVVSSEDYPWMSLDEYGRLEVDGSKYDPDNYILPTILDGELVTGFSDYCWEDLIVDEMDDIPANYVDIGDYAFSGQSIMTSITLSPYTQRIGTSAFRDCDSLTSIVTPDSLRSIGESAFAYCDYLSNVTLNAGLEEIGEDAFYDCGGLTSITIPSTVTAMGYEAFYGTSLASLTLEEGVSAIGERAFAGCEYLTSVTIPGSVTEIAPQAFYDCDTLTTVVLESGVQTVGEEAFRNCGNLTNLTLSDTLTTVGDRAFYQNYALSGSLSLPGSLTTIGAAAFYSCNGIQEVRIADNNGLVIQDEAFSYCENLTGANIGAGTTTLGNRVFRYCEAMTWVTLPEGLTTIGERCFSAANLAQVTIPSTVTTIGEGAFIANKSLSGVQIPASVSIIEVSAFQDCDALYWVWFSEGLTIVRDDAFTGCSNLSQVYFSGSAEAWSAVSKGNNDILSSVSLFTDYYG